MGYSPLLRRALRFGAMLVKCEELLKAVFLHLERVLVVQDVVTSDGRIVLSTAGPRALVADVREALCVIDRGQGGAEGIELLSLLTASDLRAAV